jgi:hypothetical protein
MTPDHIALNGARKRIEKRGLRLIGTAEAVNDFYKDHAATERQLLFDVEAAAAGAFGRPAGRPNKVLSDLIIAAHVLRVLPKEATERRYHNRAFKEVARRLGPGVSDGMVKHAYNRVFDYWPDFERHCRVEPAGSYFSLILVEQMLPALTFIDLEEAGRIPMGMPEAERCLGHVLKGVSLINFWLESKRAAQMRDRQANRRQASA